MIIAELLPWKTGCKKIANMRIFSINFIIFASVGISYYEYRF